MDELGIEGVILTPLNKICHPKGDILHGMKKCDEGFTGFGEAYFSTINNGEIKGWNRHKKITLNLIVPVGEVTFVIYDERKKSRSNSKFFEVELSLSNYQRLTVPPELWIAFKGKNNNTNIILNIADMEHDPDEIERLDLDQFDYDWESV
jgi:dTDP-4-dehydrorhamnose 3,5-epimerase